jgi:GrpB-like predicted nucleotidyltransferase (UPF0157 family)
VQNAPLPGTPDPTDAAAYDERLARVTIGGPRPLAGPIELQSYDRRWPGRYGLEAGRIRAALGDRVVRIEHVGSTSVPGLPAKPIIDIVLEVPDSADEAAYVPQLEAAGYVLRIREPGWFEHRLFKAPGEDVNVHVFPARCPETDRMLRFRDWLRANGADRRLYARTKRELAARDWKYLQQYADAKGEVVAEIMGRAGMLPFRLQFPAGEIKALAGRFPEVDEAAFLAVGAAARARGHYTRSEFIEVCAWKTVRSRPRVAINTRAAVARLTGRALAARDEAVRITALLELHGVGMPTASTLLYCAFPDDYPILDVRALESLGIKARTHYTVSFWLEYLYACRRLAYGAGVSLRTLDKALWQHSKEQATTQSTGSGGSRAPRAR